MKQNNIIFKRLASFNQEAEQNLIEWIMNDYDTDEQNAQSIWQSIKREIEEALDAEDNDRVEEIIDNELNGIDFSMVAPLLTRQVEDYSKYKGPF